MIKTTIEKLVHGGYGLGRIDGQVVFVADVLPNEVVTVDGLFKRAGCLYAQVDSIEKPSPHRRTPPCPHAGICGGCDWQHIVYAEQLRQKEAIFRECLSRIGKILNAGDIEIVASPEEGYRQRVQFKLDPLQGNAGFFARKTNSVVGIDTCPVLNDKLKEFLQKLTNIVREFPPEQTSCKAIGPIHGNVASFPPVHDVSSTLTSISVDDAVFEVDGNSFFQGNQELCGPLGRWALPYVGGANIVDLFGGVGFFSVMLGKAFTKGIMVESEPLQVHLARKNFGQNGLTHFSAITATAEAFLNDPKQDVSNIDCLVVDPPRGGLSSQVRTAIAECKPEMVLSVSCDPATQARDLGYFVNQCGYKIERMALFDMYPQTHHIETAVILRRVSSVE